MTSRKILSDKEANELRQCEYYGLKKEDSQWTAYWTDGDYTTLCKTHTDNWKHANHILKCLLSNYWNERKERMMYKQTINLIRGASKIELAELANHVRDEMELRGMGASPFDGRKIRKGVCRLKDLLNKYYFRLDVGENVPPDAD